MGGSPLTQKKIDSILEDFRNNPETTIEDRAKRFGVVGSTIFRIQKKAGISSRRTSIPATEPAKFEDIRKFLRKSAKSVHELADDLDTSPKRVAELLKEMKARGALLVETIEGKYELGSALELDKQTTQIKVENQPLNRFGVVSDNHLCNKHSRLDVLKEAYDVFEREGIKDVFNPGNWIDGEARFTKPECIVRPGVDAQIEYMLENYPQRKGITTHYIAGDDHEGWYQQRECLEIGRYLQLKAEEGGRFDLKYLGYAEADVELKNKGGSIVMRLVHPGGGSSYAISYTDQKRVESYQGGEKPQIELAGHYHKYNVGYPREVYTIQPGCTCDQTLFMRKKRLQAMVGFVILEIQQDMTDGHLLRARHEWFPYFDRKFYEKRFA